MFGLGGVCVSAVKRIFVEKRADHAVEAAGILADLRENLGLSSLRSVRVLNRYDVAGLGEKEWEQAKSLVFAEPMVDDVYEEVLPVWPETIFFAMEYLPGQYDQRADSAAQCLQLLSAGERPQIRTAKVLALGGAVTAEELERIKAYCINPVEAREAALEKPSTLEEELVQPGDVAVLTGFLALDEAAVGALHAELGLAMSAADLRFCQEYFQTQEKREPTLTEIRVLDTYWSDHCRHTTFHTCLEEVRFGEGRYGKRIAAVYDEYLATRRKVYGAKEKDRDICLMDVAVLGMKELRLRGLLDDLDASEEINACSVVVEAEVDGKPEEWLVMFKNETHNHPTEIEPFGGAATCLGGAIRDPLSGRSYVYQAMRVTGSGDPRCSLADTLPGKLSQRKITTGAASGYSSYGNQIGLATGQVAEFYDEGFVAKRMEVGAVMAAAPKENVVREQPQPGDVVILVGGRTGRDGCGGATGSSKAHTEESLATCGAEVQKGNPPTERKIQRLFRRSEVSQMIKRCNDFGAGGVSVAVGELTDGVRIELDRVPKKYEGLDGTELAISESQERMAVVVAAENAAAFQRHADEENLEATVVATVTDDRRLTMLWRDKAIVSLSRDFLDTAGVKQSTKAFVAEPSDVSFFGTAAVVDWRETWLALLGELNVCSQKGLVERFDSTIGAASVLMPLGGKHQLTPAEGMAAKLPVLQGETTTATVMTFGYHPAIGSWSPFHGALYAVVESVAKVVAMGGEWRRIRLSFQEYFERLGTDPQRWGKPLAALLGAFEAQVQLGLPAIGGKDSMSGSFQELDVPPTLISFAVSLAHASQVVSPEFKEAGSKLLWLPVARDAEEIPDFAGMAAMYDRVGELTAKGLVKAASTVRYGGIAAAVSRMSFGNALGVRFGAEVEPTGLFAPEYGSLLLEVAADLDVAEALSDCRVVELGTVTAEPEFELQGRSLRLEQAQAAWEAPLEKVFPTKASVPAGTPAGSLGAAKERRRSALRLAKPRVLIPVFPGSNCEYDTARAFEKAGAVAQTLVIRNLTPAAVEESVQAFAAALKQANILMLPGGFSAGDEPDGSGKFIATMLRNPALSEGVTELLQKRDGLVLGICNGFQALIKLGLLPFGEIRPLDASCPTLTFNSLGRHISCLARTRVTNNRSPWLALTESGDEHVVAMSHGEGRFYASPQWLKTLHAAGQVATQYVDLAGQPTHELPHNPNGSLDAIEGITSPDGRVLGKMGHSERIGENVFTNVPGAKDQHIFEAGVAYFAK